MTYHQEDMYCCRNSCLTSRLQVDLKLLLAPVASADAIRQNTISEMAKGENTESSVPFWVSAGVSDVEITPLRNIILFLQGPAR